MKSYRVLARKYRPINFSELIGQEVLTRTISNAIKNNKLAHAFLLTGTRGVGKTTAARIISKSLNCENLNSKENEKIDVYDPCGTCNTCKSIAESEYPDVVEIDAASKTGVDDVRDIIISNIAYAPSAGKFKVYIIDEVHMLSNNAFNALLKTLEEPPPHVKFIFATTEARKIPVTILSRCQRFDLRRLSEDELSNHLENVLERENLAAEKDALNLIAELSDGSIRDALSILDNALSYNNYEELLQSSTVADILSLNNKSKIIDLFEFMMKGDVKSSIDCFCEFYKRSSDILTLLQDLLGINHKITLLKTIEFYELTSFTKEHSDRLKDMSYEISISSLVRVWQLFLKGLDEISKSSNQKITFEMLLIRVCYMANMPSLESLIKKIGINKTSDSKTNNEILDQKIIRDFPDAKIL